MCEPPRRTTCGAESGAVAPDACFAEEVESADARPGRQHSAYTVCITAPVPTRFSPRQIETIDRLVAAGVGETRSEVIRRAVEHLADSVERARLGRVIADSYRTQPQTVDDDEQAMANAIAMTEAEPW